MGSIGKLIRITPQGAGRKVRLLEEKYAIEYVAEIDPVKLGFIEYLVFIKFKGNKPNTSEIRNAFEGLPIVQLCATVTGEYDVMLYVLIDVNNVNLEFESLQFGALTKYDSEWHIKSVATFYGCVPFRDVFF